MEGVRPLLDQGWVDPTGTRDGRSRRAARKQTGSSGFGRDFNDRWKITEALA